MANKKNIIKSFLFLLLLVLIAGWFASRSPLLKQEDAKLDMERASMRPEYIPIETSKPSYFMRVSGKIDPSLLTKFISEKVTAEYNTTNEACMYDASGGFEGAMTYRERKLDYMLKPNPKNGIFSIQIPLDKIVPGYCQWRITAIRYGFHYIPIKSHIQKMPRIVMAYFNTPGVGSNSNGLDIWSCGDKFCTQIDRRSIGKSQQDDLSPFQNYHYQINFRKKGA